MIGAFQVMDDSDPTRRRPRVRTVNSLESMTVQSDVVRAEMKHILAKYEQTGVLVGLDEVDLAFRDVTEFEDFSDMMRASVEAKGAFMRLPSKVREVFDHDHLRWLDAAHDGLELSQKAKLEELGVIERVEDPAKPVKLPEPEPSPPATELARRQRAKPCVSLARSPCGGRALAHSLLVYYVPTETPLLRVSVLNLTLS